MNESLQQPRQIRKFNPGTFQSDEELVDQFVVRNRELGIVLDVLRGNLESPSCQHVLLVAPRGRGKTMLLARVAAELRIDDKLSEHLLPVRFMEESQEIFNVSDFWLESLFYLAREQAVRDPDLTQELQAVHGALTTEPHGRELEERARAAVLETADRLDMQLVLMVENLQALCRDVDDDFGWKLRKVLQSEPRIILLATATSRFKELDDTQHAFFELFRMVRLDPLDTGECRCLWQLVSGDAVSERGIKPLQILTGGSPRLLIIIGEFARHRSLRQLMEELVKLVDDHTEYFRGHLEVFAKAERRVYLATIDLWQPSTTGEIAARARMDVRAVSALLGRLVERGAVILEGSGRKRMYAAAERLYSIYYKLRRERDEAAVVRNLIHFMATFYSETELAEFAGRLRSEAARWPAIRAGVEQAMAELPQIGRIFPNDGRQSIRQTSADTPAIRDEGTRAILREVMSASEKAEHTRVIELVDRLSASLRDELPHDEEPVLAPTLFAKAIAHESLGEYEFSISTYDQVIDCLRDNDNTGSMVLVAKALFNRGIAHDQIGDTQAEMATYDEIIERFGDSEIPDLQVLVAMALVNKGTMHGQVGSAKAEMATYDEAVKRFGDSDNPELQVKVAIALLNKGITHGRLDDAQAEMATYDEVVERFGHSGVSDLQVLVAKALVNRGTTHGQVDDAQAEVATYDEVVKRFGHSDMPELQVRTAEALINKGIALGQINSAQAAVATYDEVVERFGHSDMPELQVQIANALFNKGITHHRLDDIQAALAAYDQLIGRFRASEVPALRIPVAKALVNKGGAHLQLGDAQEVLAAHDEIIERFGNSDVPELQIQVAKSLVSKAEAKIRSGGVEEALSTCGELERRIRALTGSETAALERGAKWLRTKALFILKQHPDAMEEFRTVYAMFLPNEDAVVREMLGHVPNLIAAGAYESDLVEALSGDKEKADVLLPLIVALRQHAGETVRAPAEVLEIATDIRGEFIAAMAGSSDTNPRRTPSA